ncbi:MAG: insulinase family protein [Myxococcales bacterium]|nr:insulinase family protein [Myxococcales bacterium]
MHTFHNRHFIVVTLLILGTYCSTSSTFATPQLLPEVTRIQLDNGLVILMAPHPEVPLISISAVLRGGTLADPDGKEGLAGLTADLLRKGTEKYTAEQLANLVDSNGAIVTNGVDRDSTGVYLEFLSKDTETAVDLLGELLIRPTFPEAEIAKTKIRQVDGILAAKEDPRYVISRYFSSFLYEKHPYGRPGSGTETSIPKLTRQDVVDFHTQHYGPDRMILAISGDFDPTSMETLIKHIFGGWRNAQSPLPQAEPGLAATTRRVLLVDKPGATQTYFYIGNLGVAHNYPDRVVLDTVQTLFGGRFTSMLNTALRIESGLTYGARNVINQPMYPGENAIFSYTETSTTKDAVDMALGVLEELRTKPFSAAQLESARSYIRGQLPPTLESSGSIASKIAELELYRLGLDEINGYLAKLDKVTVENTRSVISEVYPASETLVMVFIGDAEQIRDVVAAYGPLTEKKISDPGF